MRRSLGLCLAAVALGPGVLAAQLAPVGAPKGTLRFDIQGMFESADRRFFMGQTEDYLADFSSPALGQDRLPYLRASDSVLALILGQPGYRLNLGRQNSHGQLTIGTANLGVALGVTSKLTLFANVPLVQTRVQASLGRDTASGTAGLNPAHPIFGTGTEQGQAASFFGEFANALATLDAQIAGGTYAGNPALDSVARAISARGATLRDQLFQVTADPLGAAPFLPTSGSAAGQKLIDLIRDLQDTLANTLSVSSGFTTDPVLPAGRLTEPEFQGFVSNPFGPVAGFPLQEAKISRIGDMDVGAVYTLIDRFDRRGRQGGVRLAVTGLLRLPTGQRDDPNNFLDVGTGNGRYEAGVSGTADLGRGAIGLRATGGYLVRFATLRVRRVSDPATPLPLAATLTNLRVDAGDVLSLGVRPFLRLAPNFAVHGLADYQRAGADAVRYDSPGDVLTGIDPSVMAEAARSALAIGGGVSYVGRAVHECRPNGRCGLPIDASWNYRVVVHGSGGRVLKSRTTFLEVRWYQRLWR